MVQFIDFEVSDESDLDSLLSFIDNEENNDDINFYRTFNNVEVNIDEILKNEYEEGSKDIDNFDEISNLRESSEEETEIDDFKNSEEKVKKFSQSLLSKSNENEEDEHIRFIKAILYPIRYEKENKTNICDKNEFKDIIEEELINELDKKRSNLYLIYKNLTITVMR